MDANTFDRLAAKTRLTERSLRMARAILVEGLGAAEAGRGEGLTRQRAADAAQRVLRELRAEGGYPSGWETVTVVVPGDVAAQIEDLARDARRAAGLQVD